MLPMHFPFNKGKTVTNRHVQYIKPATTVFEIKLHIYKNVVPGSNEYIDIFSKL